MIRDLLSRPSHWCVLFLVLATAWVSQTSAEATVRRDIVNPEWIPADAEWVIHLNIEAIATSELMTALCGAESGSGYPMNEIRAQMEQDLGFDLFAHAKSLTIHGRSIMVDIDAGGDQRELSTSAMEVGAVAVMTAAADDLLAGLISEVGDGEHHVIESARGSIHKFGAADAAPGEAAYIALSPGTSDDERILIAAANTERIERIRDTMSGLGASVISSDDSGLTVKPRNGSMIYFSGSSMQDFFRVNAGGMIDSRVIKLVNSASMELSEQGRLVRFDITLDTENEDAVRRVRGVIQGMVSLGQMVSAEVPELEFVQTLTDALRFNSNESRLSIGMALNVNDVRDIMNGLMADQMGQTSENGNSDAKKGGSETANDGN